MNRLAGRWGELLTLLLICVVAGVVRLYELDKYPPGLYLDEAAYGLDALDVLDGNRAIFFERNNGREPLFIYWQALMIAWLGATPLALRTGAALIGVATVPAFYWLTRVWLQHSPLPSRWVATYAALFLAVSYWHISLSRLGFRAILLPLMACVALAAFWQAWQQMRKTARLAWPLLIVCGIATGLTLYTYTAGRFVPVVITLLVATAWVIPQQAGVTRQRSLGALLIIGAAAALVFAPLASYFWHHPQSFFGRASEVSIFSERVAGDDPLLALGRSIFKMAAMFFTLPDPNLRHNPAARPVFDLPLALWWSGGVVLALAYGRRFWPLFPLLWLGVMALPAILTAQALPHSLRGIGMIPPALLLPVMALGWLRQRLAGRWRLLAFWLPLPFLLFSALTSVQDYFAAWRDPAPFRLAFLTDDARVGEGMVQQGNAENVWLLPFSPNYYLSDATFSTIQFFVRGRTPFGEVLLDEASAPADLATLTEGFTTASVLNIREATSFENVSFVTDDIKNLLDFLLRKHGRLIEQHPQTEIGVPYSVYALPERKAFVVVDDPQAVDVVFGERIKLLTQAYGRSALALSDTPADLARQQAPDGHALWVYLRWQPLTMIDYDLKASLLLKDDAGHVAGQVDNLLVGDHYPVFREWLEGAPSSTYHIVPILSAVPPGPYTLYVKVYEDESGLVYPASAEQGQALGSEVAIGTVEIVRAATWETPEPTQPLAAANWTGVPIHLAGYELPGAHFAPGDTLPLTLYWVAAAEPARDYQVQVQLLDEADNVVASQTGHPGQDRFPTSQWRAGETLRDWYDLPLSPELPSGAYSITINLLGGPQPSDPLALASITIQGRPRQFEAPAITQAFTSQFGRAVRLLGVDEPETLTASAGETLPLTLVWQVQEPPPTALVRFVQLLGPAGPPAAQQDSIPCNGECPATSWVTTEILVDPVALTLPETTEPGDYQLIVGWYDPATLGRLEATAAAGTRWADDAAVLPITVQIR